MNRRTFLLRTGKNGMGLVAIASASGILGTGCGASVSNTLTVRLLKNSIPVQLVTQFRKQRQPVVLDFAPEARLRDLFALLEQLKQGQVGADSPDGRRFSLPWLNPRPDRTPDLVTLGDSWLDRAIRDGLIRPLDPERLAEWKNLPSKWQELVKRRGNGDGGVGAEEGVWGAPYSWGTTAIAFRRDRFRSLGWEPQDWGDLWRSPLEGRISLLDHPREIIGLTLKKLGYSYNSKNPANIPNLEAELRQLHRQAKFYSSDNYLQPLIHGDTWAAVGWSSDILPIMQRYDLGAAVPLSGTSLWADLWVRPVSSSDRNNSLASQWIDFCWQRDRAGQFSLLAQRSFPAIASGNRDDLPKALRENPILLPDDAILQNSEFLLPLPEETLKQYEELWKKIRTSRSPDLDPPKSPLTRGTF